MKKYCIGRQTSRYLISWHFIASNISPNLTITKYFNKCITRLIQVTFGLHKFKRRSKWRPLASRYLCVRTCTANYCFANFCYRNTFWCYIREGNAIWWENIAQQYTVLTLLGIYMYRSTDASFSFPVPIPVRYFALATTAPYWIPWELQLDLALFCFVWSEILRKWVQRFFFFFFFKFGFMRNLKGLVSQRDRKTTSWSKAEEKVINLFFQIPKRG